MSTGLHPYRLFIVLLLLGILAFAQLPRGWASEDPAVLTCSLVESIAGDAAIAGPPMPSIRPVVEPMERVDAAPVFLANAHLADLISILRV
jgi:hypothetical protein